MKRRRHCARFGVGLASTIVVMALVGGGCGGDPPAPVVPAPMFDPPPGTYEGPVTLTLRDVDSAGVSATAVFYTLDGSLPSSNATQYTAPMELSASTTVKAVTVRDGVSSEVITGTYVLGGPCDNHHCGDFGTCSVIDGVAVCTCIGGSTGDVCPTPPSAVELTVLRGVVYDVDGTPISDAAVTVTSLSASVPFSGTVTTQLGAYEISDAPAGVTLLFTVSKAGYTWRQRAEVALSNRTGDPSAYAFDFHAYAIESFVVTAAASSLEVGATLPLTATLKYTDRSASAVTATWTVDQSSIATVDASTGVVTALASGAVTVTASFTDGTHSATDAFQITVAAACPAGFVRIPHDPSDIYTTEDFCLAKYIASAPASSETAARSVPGEVPWTSINYAAAQAACEAMGTGYHLVTNDEWQTVARNIESVPQNWSLGHVPIDDLGAGAENTNRLNRGKVEGSIGGHAPVAASDDDHNACYATESTCDGDTWSIDRRTFRLNTGAVLWDMAGNVWQWVDYGVPATSGYLFSADIMTLTASVHADAKAEFGPHAEYDFLLSMTPYGGLGFAELYFAAPSGIFRGGSLYSGVARQGVFSVRTDKALSYSDSIYGFRCAYQP